MNLKNTYGIYIQWSLGNDIYPDDLEVVIKFKPSGKVMECVDDNGDYLTLERGNIRFRLKKKCFTVLPKPKYKFGNKVSLRKYPEKDVIITNIGWHFKDEKHIYKVKVDGKLKSKRYNQEDFV